MSLKCAVKIVTNFTIRCKKDVRKAEVSKNLAKFRCESNFVWIIKIIKLKSKMLKLFAASVTNVLHNYFLFNKIIFTFVSS